MKKMTGLIRKFISALLLFAMLLPSVLALDISALNLSDESSSIGESVEIEMEEILRPSELPETVSDASVLEKGHIKRLYEEETDLYTVVFKNRDGTETAYLFSEPVKYIENGTVKDKSTVISVSTRTAQLSNGTSYTYASTENDIKVYYGQNTQSGVTIAFGDYQIVCKPNVRRADAALTSGNRTSTDAVTVDSFASASLSAVPSCSVSTRTKNAVLYSNAIGNGVTLEYIPLLNGLKENILISRYNGVTTYSFLYETNGLSIVNEGGTLYLKTPEGETCGKFGAIYCYDAAGNEAYGTCTVHPITENQSYRLTVSVPDEFLQTAVYPVTVDPTITTQISAPMIQDLTLYNSTEYDDDGEPDVAVGAYSALGCLPDHSGNYRILYGLTAEGRESLESLLARITVESATLCVAGQSGEDTYQSIYAYPHDLFWNPALLAEYCAQTSSRWQYYGYSNADEECGAEYTPSITPAPTSAALDDSDGEFRIDITECVAYWAQLYYDDPGLIQATPYYSILLRASSEGVGVWDDNYIRLCTRDYGGNAYLVFDYEAYSGVYYINNKETGQFITRTSSTAVYGRSGCLEDVGTYEDYFEDQITFILEELGQTVDSTGEAHGIYGIRYYRTQEYLYDVGNGYVGFRQCSNRQNLPETAKWYINGAAGSLIPSETSIVNVCTSRNMYVSGTGSRIYCGSTSSSASATWRFAKRTAYVELQSVTFDELLIDAGETRQVSIKSKTPSATFANIGDFTYSIQSGNSYTSFNSTTLSFTGVTIGKTTVRATHKVTGLATDFEIKIKIIYMDYLMEVYQFDFDIAKLLVDLYTELTVAYPDESELMLAWRYSRMLGGIIYDDESNWKKQVFANFWRIVAGPSQESLLETLGLHLEKYDDLIQVIQNKHDRTDSSVADFAHMQISLAARLAYYLNITDLGVINVIFTGESISYLAGWLGDATLPENDGTTSFGNDDYIADLDAENIYRLLIGDMQSLIDATETYYNELSETNTRATCFLQYINYNEIKNEIYFALVDYELYLLVDNANKSGDYALALYYLSLIEDEEYHVMMIRDRYPDTYNFLCSMYDELHEIGEYVS